MKKKQRRDVSQPPEPPPRESSRGRGRSSGDGGGTGDGKGKKGKGKRTRSHGDDVGEAGAMSNVEWKREEGQDRGRRREMLLPSRYGPVEMVEVGGEWWL